MSIVVFYHKNCRDGFASAAIAAKFYMDNMNNPENMVYVAVDPNTILEDLHRSFEYYKFDKRSCAYSFDVAFTSEAYQLVRNRFQVINILDHHKTTIDNLCALNLPPLIKTHKPPLLTLRERVLPQNVKVDVNSCGCVMTWKFFYGDDVPIPQFLLYLQDRDLWTQMQPFSEIVNEGLFHLIDLEFESDNKPNFSKWIEYMSDSDIWYESALFIGQKILANKNKQITNIIKNISFVTFTPVSRNFTEPFNTYNIALLNSTSYISEIGNIAAGLGDVHFAVIYRIVGTKVLMSLRSVGDFDVSIVAKMFNGGGHKNAASMSCDLNDFIVDAYKLSINN